MNIPYHLPNVYNFLQNGRTWLTQPCTNQASCDGTSLTSSNHSVSITARTEHPPASNSFQRQLESVWQDSISKCGKPIVNLHVADTYSILAYSVWTLVIQKVLSYSAASRPDEDPIIGVDMFREWRNGSISMGHGYQRSANMVGLENIVRILDLQKMNNEVLGKF